MSTFISNRLGAVRRASRGRSRAGGFTLVEILMVVAIIGILVGLITVAAGAALSRAARARVVIEINQLSSKMEEYKGAVGEYPPSFCLNGSTPSGILNTVNRFMSHLRKAFSRYQPNMGTDAGYSSTRLFILNNFNYVDISGTVQPLDTNTLDQAEALVFWLGGLPTPFDTSISPPQRFEGKYLCGFSANPSNPFVYVVGGDRKPAMFEFVETRLQDADLDGWLEYVPDFKSHTAGFDPPFVYFDSGTYAYNTAPLPVPLYYGYPNLAAPVLGPPGFLSQWGMAVPYFDSAKSPKTYLNTKTFQILCAGQDFVYGIDVPTEKYFPDGSNYSEFDHDNLTNFTKDRLQDAQP